MMVKHALYSTIFMVFFCVLSTTSVAMPRDVQRSYVEHHQARTRFKIKMKRTMKLPTVFEESYGNIHKARTPLENFASIVLIAPFKTQSIGLLYDLFF